MRKLQIIILALSCLFLCSTGVSANEADDAKTILRHVITKIEWDDFDKRIVVHKVVIQKYDNQPIQIYPSERVISGDSFQNQKMTDGEAEEFVRKYEPDIFTSDMIFGHEVEVFKDLSGDHNVSQTEIDKWVKLAEQQVEKDYQSPPEFKDSSESVGLNKFFDSFVVVLLLVVLVLFFILSRFTKKFKNRN
ncbi:hypothetical protein [Paenibacillus gansuensis]|uniref:Uncharacterized protein n=1 Tax=Paenibacillus gansuensis TaxID=306542 RepID=A0ABW5PHJ2_9BACL